MNAEVNALQCLTGKRGTLRNVVDDHRNLFKFTDILGYDLAITAYQVSISLDAAYILC